ncbi:hypothetical protein BDV12DRAFT_201606 [Aspergillus spectabilis]
MDQSCGFELLDLHPFVRETVLDKVRGTIFGGALGDAIGLYTEFLSRDLSVASYPEGKFQLVEPATELRNDGHRNKFVKTGWTDDTDHALLIVLSYLHNGHLDPLDFARRLQFWCEQGLRCLDRLPLGLGKTVGSVVCDSGFLQNPTETAYRHWKKGNYKAAPNGSLMRTHPLGVICIDKTLNETFLAAIDFSRVSHADPRCIVSCCLATSLVRGLLRGEIRVEHDIECMIDASYAFVEKWVAARDRVPNDAECWAQDPLLDREEYITHTHRQSLGELELDDSMKMGYVYKALGSAILLLRRALRRGSNEAPDDVFEELVTELVMQGGDADTNAAVAGSLLGAWLGYTALPEKWKRGMMHSQWLFQKCNALAFVSGIDGRASFDEEWEQDTTVEGGKPRLTPEELRRREHDFVVEYMAKSGHKAPEHKAGWIGRLLGR